MDRTRKKQFAKAQSWGSCGMPRHSGKRALRKARFSDAGSQCWWSKFGGTRVSDAKRPKELEIENGRLKKRLADLL